MELRRYKSSDKDQLDLWYNAHQMPPMAAVPKRGFIVPGIGAGFMMVTDDGLALLDGYITNPAASWDERQRAIDDITAALLSEANRGGFRQVLAITTAQGIYDRALRLGFQDIGNFRVLRLDRGQSGISSFKK